MAFERTTRLTDVMLALSFSFRQTVVRQRVIQNRIFLYRCARWSTFNKAQTQESVSQIAISINNVSSTR